MGMGLAVAGTRFVSRALVISLRLLLLLLFPQRRWCCRRRRRSGLHLQRQRSLYNACYPFAKEEVSLCPCAFQYEPVQRFGQNKVADTL